VAQGKRTSLAVRAVALGFAVALAALAAKLWLGPKPGTGDSLAGAAAGEPEEVSSAPPQHGDLSDEDREALRKILRESRNERP
jgi:uncharacterized membrane protein